MSELHIILTCLLELLAIERLGPQDAAPSRRRSLPAPGISRPRGLAPADLRLAVFQVRRRVVDLERRPVMLVERTKGGR